MIDGLWSIQNLSKELNTSERNIRWRIDTLKLKGLQIGQKYYYDESDLNRIKHYARKNKNNHRRKITIIEFYLKQQSYRAVSETLNLRRNIITATVKEWFDNEGYITVESKMNDE